METIVVDKDVTVMCITAKSFPDGVLQAHQKLHALVPPGNNRRYYGLSRPEKTVIIYHAAAEQLEDNEASEFGLHTITIKKGRYISITIKDFMSDISSIGRAFEQLLQEPDQLDPEGYCVEEYINDIDVICMVRLKD